MVELYPDHHPDRRQRHQDQRNGQVGRREQAEPPIGQDLGVVHHAEQNDDRADMNTFVQPLRQQVHRNRRQAGMNDETGKTGNRAQNIPDRFRKKTGYCFLAARAEEIDKEGDSDDPDHQPDKLIVHPFEGQHADHRADQAADNEHFHARAVPVPAIGPYAHQVHHAQDRQHDRDRLNRR